MCIGQSAETETNFNITYNGQPIHQVTSYRYLGILFDNAGDAFTAKNDSYKRALKVYYKLTKALQPLPKVSTLVHLFDSLLKPILMYGSEIIFPSKLDTRLPNLTGDDRKDFFISLKHTFPIISKLYERDSPAHRCHHASNNINVHF